MEGVKLMILTKNPEYITHKVKSAETVAARSHSMSELKLFSRALLHQVVYGDNSASMDKLLRVLYWNTVKTLANLDDYENRS